MKIAFAVMAKTPGYSTFKTRLAMDIGSELTEEFYNLSIAATNSALSNLSLEGCEIDILFGVAEEEAQEAEFWKGKKTLTQSKGCLGERQFSVLNKLHEQYNAVFLLGADTPHLNMTCLGPQIKNYLNGGTDFLLGPSHDGGYYIFGSKKLVPLSLWKNVKYSTSNTYAELSKQLDLLGEKTMVNSNFDIDDLDSLLKLNSIMIAGRTPEQREVFEFAKKLENLLLPINLTLEAI